MSDPDFDLCPHHRELEDCLACLRARYEEAEGKRLQLLNALDHIRTWAVKTREEYRSGERVMVGPSGPIPCHDVLDSPIAPLLHITGMCSEALRLSVAPLPSGLVGSSNKP